MDDRTLLALCLYSEAQGEPHAGKCAVAQVILNRMREHFQSDGTVLGTVLHPNAFSGFWYAFRGDSYVRVARTLADAETRAAILLVQAEQSTVWPECLGIASQALSGELPSDPGLDKAVSYLNPAILKQLPAWASADKKLCSIGRHDFFEAA